MPTAIVFDKVSKKYRLGAGQTNLREFLSHSAGRLLNRNNNRKDTQTLWALRDVEFELARGEALGLIGPNGAGKSTALKLLARITRPTTGRIETNGRVASLIELGAGFHNDLTGRENIFLNASILGLSQKRAKDLFDQIVAFSDLEKFIDTPIKRYSSGMQVRLGFAVAAHVEPEILLVDEVLAVGDSQFRQRCITRIEELQAQGATVVFVSHNLYMVKSVCNQGIFLADGKVQKQGDVVNVINAYESWFHDWQRRKRSEQAKNADSPVGASAIDITRVEIVDRNGFKQDEFIHEEPVIVRISYEVSDIFKEPNLVLHFVRADGVTSSMIRTGDYNYELADLQGRGVISVIVDPLQLTGGAYVVEARILGGMDVPLATGHSQWFHVRGLGLSSRERGGVFVPRVGGVTIEPHSYKNEDGVRQFH